ncbi:MAG TPA: monovalent cation:proton antiporter-2 (CPA2) family protein [Caulobacterales bacterium]|nr:monovalent cation:proton antiporter-2 (CPA2) family protein [Caulobacterales bacterium]
MEHASPLLSAFIYLAAALLAVPMAKRLGLGAVPGYIIAGAVIGPFGFKFLNQPGETMHVAEFGVVIMLFLIGLEIQPAVLWRMRRTVMGLGGAQMALTAFAITAIAMLLGLDWRTGLACGLILALSSTAVAMAGLRERGQGGTPPGRAAFAVLLFQDLAVIPLLALLPLLAAPGAETVQTPLGHYPIWAQTMLTLGAVGLVIVLGRVVVRPLFRFIAETGLREIFTVAALAIVAGVAVLMQSVGMSPALGAFIAGVALADSEFRHELESDIEPFRGILLGLFFISIGAGINFHVLYDAPFIVLGLVVGLMALKAAIGVAIARVSSLKGPDAILVGLAIAQGGEFAFVLLGIGSTLGVVRTQIADLLIAVVALSMAATPLLFLLGERVIARFATPPKRAREEIEHDRPHAVVAGFGRFGQVVGRMLTGNGFRISVLENSASQIDTLRAFGVKVNYGDASRIELLRAAGAETARVLVIAIDDREKALEIAEEARKHFPRLRIMARAFDRLHVYELRRRGADEIEREMFEGSLRMGVKTLVALGLDAANAERAGRIFRRHDEAQLNEMAQFYGDDEAYRLASRERSAMLNEVMRRDLGFVPAEQLEAAWALEDWSG